MKARTWFHALGQSHEARCMPYALCVASMKLDALPHWVKQAYSAGRLSVRHAGFAAMLTRLSQGHDGAVTRDIGVTFGGQRMSITTTTAQIGKGWQRTWQGCVS